MKYLPVVLSETDKSTAVTFNEDMCAFNNLDTFYLIESELQNPMGCIGFTQWKGKEFVRFLELTIVVREGFRNLGCARSALKYLLENKCHKKTSPTYINSALINDASRKVFSGLGFKRAKGLLYYWQNGGICQKSFTESYFNVVMGV